MFNFIKSIFVFASLLNLTGCVTLNKEALRDSFLQVHKTVIIAGCGTDPDDATVDKCAEFMKLGAVGSASVVYNEYTFGGGPRTLVMTADHVCHSDVELDRDSVPPIIIESFKKQRNISGDIKLVISERTLTLKDNNGTNYKTTNIPWIRNEKADICIIETSMNKRALLVSDYEPSFGDDIINISAPYGLMYSNSSGGAVYITEGLYGGVFNDFGYTRNMYTVWTAPGSSGSPIINSRGEIVGLVSSISTLPWSKLSTPMVGVVSAPSNITFGPTLKDIQSSIQEAIAAMRRGKPFNTSDIAISGMQEGKETRANEGSEEERNDVPPIILYQK